MPLITSLLLGILATVVSVRLSLRAWGQRAAILREDALFEISERHCPRCAYPRSPSRSRVCPECGWSPDQQLPALAIGDLYAPASVSLFAMLTSVLIGYTRYLDLLELLSLRFLSLVVIDAMMLLIVAVEATAFLVPWIRAVQDRRVSASEPDADSTPSATS